MTLSMTAFARCERSTSWGDLTWELRSVNHRYLEINPRLPEDLRRLEPQVRDRLSSHIGRGRIDCNLRFQPKEAGVGDIDSEVTRQLAGLSAKIEHLAPGLQPLRAIDVLRWPGVMRSVEADPEQLDQAVLELLEQTMGELIENRRREGERLRELMLERLKRADELIDDVGEILPQAAAAHRKRLEDRVAECQEQLDPTRLEQEVVLLLHKADVQEELDRLGVHITEIRRVLDEQKPVGRRLDFLIQELHREANTLGSKSADARLSAATIDLKVVIEQMREQTQNIE